MSGLRYCKVCNMTIQSEECTNCINLIRTRCNDVIDKINLLENDLSKPPYIKYDNIPVDHYPTIYEYNKLVKLYNKTLVLISGT